MRRLQVINTNVLSLPSLCSYTSYFEEAEFVLGGHISEVLCRNRYMNPKNSMEDKQLDLNQPFLSVRRFSSTTASSEADEKRKVGRLVPKLPSLPTFKSELKSGPVSDPGNVPFLWERAPGRPKDESKSLTQPREQPYNSPKLPPGRVSNVKQKAPNKGSKHTQAARSQAANIIFSSPNVSNMKKKNVIKYESSLELMKDQTSSSSEDGSQAYVDALDTLSRSESFFMNCSLSGVSGLDGPDVKPSGTFATDPQAQDFMMNRFLSAAKAMASETHQSATRKQLVAWEQPRQTNKVADQYKQRPLNQCRQNVLPDNAPAIGLEESEDEADDYDYDRSKDLSTKLCGLLPRCCLKNSLFLLNREPGIKMQAQLSPSSVRAKPSYIDSCHEVKDELRSVICDGKSTYGQKTVECPVPLQGPEVSTHKNGDSQPVLGKEKGFLNMPEETNNAMESGIDFQRKGVRSFRDLLANENTECELPSQSPVAEKTLHVDSVCRMSSPNAHSSDTKDITEDVENDFQIPERTVDIEKTSSDSSQQSLRNLTVVIEKVAEEPEISKSNDSCFLSCSYRSTNEKEADMRKCMRLDGDLISGPITEVADKENFDIESKWTGKSSGQENSHGFTKDSPRLTSLKIIDDKNIHLDSQQTSVLGIEESLGGRNPDTLRSSIMDNVKRIYSKSQPPIKSGTQRSSQSLVQISNKEAAINHKVDLEKGQLVKVGRQQSSDGSYSKMPLALPSPKSPSESWLKRTLPVVSSKNSSLKASLAACVYTSSSDSKTSSLDPKWERVVKTSNIQNGRLRFSEEFLTPIPEA